MGSRSRNRTIVSLEESLKDTGLDTKLRLVGQSVPFDSELRWCKTKLVQSNLCNSVLYQVQNVIELRPPFLKRLSHRKTYNFCKAMEEEGLDSDGNRYATRRDLWSAETGTDHMKQSWYEKGVNYWSGVEPSIDGVLGGYGSISGQDIVDSNKFLLDCLKTLVPGYVDRKLVALDCGAGVGRVTKNLLVHHFDEVDLIEPVEQLLNSARANLHDEIDGSGSKAINFYHNSLQDFAPSAERYDVIWIQWCIGHLTDEDVVAFLVRAKQGLKPGGFIVMKENIAKSGFVLDKVDSSVTRSDEYFRDLFQHAELHVYKHRLQTAFPRELFMVDMYCLTTENKKERRKKKGKPRKRGNRPGVIK